MLIKYFRLLFAKHGLFCCWHHRRRQLCGIIRTAGLSGIKSCAIAVWRLMLLAWRGWACGLNLISNGDYYLYNQLEQSMSKWWVTNERKSSRGTSTRKYVLSEITRLPPEQFKPRNQVCKPSIHDKKSTLLKGLKLQLAIDDAVV